MVTALSYGPHKLDSSLFKVFRWSPDFSPKKDSSLAAVWVRFINPHLMFFIPSYLQVLSSTVGTFLKSDVPTRNLTRPSFARVCLELDLSLTSKSMDYYRSEHWVLAESVL